MTKVDALRSKIMRAVRSKDTGPEVTVRQISHQLGYRFRLHRKDLPGTPDLVFPKYRKVIFVHGCFWHGHDCPRGSRSPKTNSGYWRDKIVRNRARDLNAVAKLGAMGWTVKVLWECEIQNQESLRSELSKFMKSKG
jgi:DNA mismatch endonuclease, patch repair protein